MDAATPGPLASDVLDREDVKRALAEHDFAAAFALFKKWGGLSQNRIASACQLTPGKVSTIISGRHQVTSFDVVRRISDGLRIPGRMLGLADRPWEREPAAPDSPVSPATRSSDDAPWHPTATVQLATDLTRSDLVMDRRAATRALAGAALTGAALLDSVEGWLQMSLPSEQKRGRGRLGHREVEQLEFTARAFRAWDHRFGGGLRRKAVVGQLNEVAAHLEEHQVPAIERGLFRVMAYLGGTAATMAWDSGMHKQAQSYYQLALRAAHAGGDDAFGANVIAGMARQMLYRNRPQDALELVHLAQKGSQKSANPRVRALLHTREAWAYAAMGRSSAFRRATGEAADALADAGHDNEPYWIAYFDEAELAGVTGGRLLDLARQDPHRHAEDAAGSIQRALATRGPEAGRSHALDLIGLAECHFLLGDVTSAVDHTRLAVDAAGKTQSARVRAQVSQLYPYTVGRGSSRPVSEARTMIRDLLSN
ncbi:helix-turn-helix transcriptional regulator [Streptomyces sp. AK08-02]|uniref:helix-turn-helix transcriptional regulator n=1 Tax=Streptomyces sp. AK08-02 TaxID=3028654 RepID=UPI0029BD2510|nr:helix-turn-helix transcriptional regulator [Streptomyces sp. AK08-02]MDX3746710.1 helix-turn-helix transcriptional regulator [Streptomyces sp. AK08-02]